MSRTTTDLAERIREANLAVRKQWAKYDEAIRLGKPRVALIQIDRKLVRLERELEDLEIEASK